MDEIDENPVLSKVGFAGTSLEDLYNSECSEDGRVGLQLVDNFLDECVDVSIEDAGIIVYVHEVPEREDLLRDAVIETGKYFAVSLDGKVVLYFVGFESSHPEEDVNKVYIINWVIAPYRIH